MVAADLLSQAEHDELASAILITTSERLAKEVSEQVDGFLETLSRREIIQKSLDRYGYILLADSLEEAAEAADEIASEQPGNPDGEPLRADDPKSGMRAPFSWESIPANRWAIITRGPITSCPLTAQRGFFSPLSVDDFIKKTSIISYSRDALKDAHEKIERFARQEGLTAHENSIRVRFERE